MLTFITAKMHVNHMQAAGGGHFEHKMQHLSFMIFCIGILRPNSEILLFCSVNTGCFVEYNACYVLHFVTAIILRHTKNI